MIHALGTEFFTGRLVGVSPQRFPQVLGTMIVRDVFASNLGAGDNDLYTCPAGKVAFVSGLLGFNTNAVTCTVIQKLKIGGTLYRWRANVTASTNSITSQTPFAVLNAGDSFTINTSVAGLSTWLLVEEFDVGVFPLKRVEKLASWINGDNTIYTVPTGKRALLLSILAAAVDVWLIGIPLSSGALVYWNNSGTSRTLNVHIVPVGGSPTANNKVHNAIAVANDVIQGLHGVSVLESGTFINVNTNAVTDTQALWLNLLEIPAY